MSKAGSSPKDGNWLREVLKDPELQCYLDVDIDGARAAYALASDFVVRSFLTTRLTASCAIRCGMNKHHAAVGSWCVGQSVSPTPRTVLRHVQIQTPPLSFHLPLTSSTLSLPLSY